MDRQQTIYLSIYRAFEEKGIEFAYPTQTLILNKGHAKPATAVN
jgi:small-conductance mechanosensitive channel